jgi:hypothetical protein
LCVVVALVDAVRHAVAVRVLGQPSSVHHGAPWACSGTWSNPAPARRRRRHHSAALRIHGRALGRVPTLVPPVQHAVGVGGRSGSPSVHRGAHWACPRTGRDRRRRRRRGVERQPVASTLRRAACSGTCRSCRARRRRRCRVACRPTRRSGPAPSTMLCRFSSGPLKRRERHVARLEPDAEVVRHPEPEPAAELDRAVRLRSRPPKASPCVQPPPSNGERGRPSAACGEITKVGGAGVRQSNRARLGCLIGGA